jgi:glutamine amidotransferase
MIAIIDYGVGNLFSLKSSFAAIGEETVVTSSPEVIKAADKLVLPGVGAFADAVEKLESSGLVPIITEQANSGKPLLGVCLGMQLLFESSEEYGEHKGLWLLKGSILGMEGRIGKNLKIPHIGWNALHIKKENPLLKYVKEGDCVYFVHSFYAAVSDGSLIATTDYGEEITAAVASANVYGCQFHPEKSGEVGLSILRAFSEL